jgi:hypothetical protein
LTGIIKIFPLRESLVRDIPPVDGKMANLFSQCILRKNEEYAERNF